jgi:hypothetical protein
MADGSTGAAIDLNDEGAERKKPGTIQRQMQSLCSFEN